MAQESILRIVIDSRNAERNARNIARELQNIERNGDYASRSMDSMSVATRQLAGYMAGIVTVGAAISKMDAYTGLQNRLKLVTDSQTELHTAMNDTFAIAQKTASSWDSVAMVYQRFADNADRLGISMKQTAALTETVSKAISVSGGSAASAEAALMQFGQALASGVLRGEEFNSIAEQAPGLLKAIAMGMDTNIGKLRAMAAEGKVTGDALVEALSKAKPYIDDLFNKTDFTIAQSFTQLSNEITKFVGAAGAGSGAAAGLSAAISGLANNLSTIANIAVIGGVALLTKTIAAQTVAIHGSISAVAARRAADAAALQSQVQLAAVEVQRTRQVAALALTEINLARQEFNSATTRQARAAATMRLTQAEIAHSIALKQSTAAIATNTAAQNALNASRAIGTRMLALVGGPIGAITLGVAGLAAGYMYLKDRTAEANKKLEEQANVAKKAKDELIALKGLEKDSAINDMTAAFERQNKALAESSSRINMQLNAIEQLYKGNKEIVQVVQDARNGTISMSEAIQRFNELRISKEVYESVKANTAEFEKNAKEATNTKVKLNLFGVEVELSGRKAQTAALGVDENSEALDKNRTAADKAAKAQKDYFASLNQEVLSANERLAYMNLGYSKEVIDQINKLQEAKQKALGDGVTAIVTTEEINKIVRTQKALDAVKDKEDQIAQSKRNQTRELEKQTKLTEKQLKNGQRLIGISGNSGIGTGAHLDVRYGGSRDGEKVSKAHLARLQAGGKSLSSYKVTSDYGQRKAPTKGASSFHKGIDFAMPVGTPITTSVAVKDVKTAYDAKGGGYYSTVTFEDGVVLKLLHQAPSVMSKVKGGSSDGTLKSNQDLERQAEQQAKTQLQLQMAVATERKRIETQLQEDIKEINKAGFSPEETKRLIAEYQARADNDIAIAEYALRTKLDDYKDFQKSEEELLRDSFDQRKFYAARDVELTKQQRNEAVQLLEKQYQHELALILLANEERLFQTQQMFISETAAMEERYRLERERIRLNMKLTEEQKQREITLSRALEAEEKRRSLNRATQQWGQINAEMTGTSEQWRLNQERFTRMDASQEVFDTEISQPDQAAQDTNANMQEIAAQREAIWQAHHDRMTAIESDYYYNSQALQLAGMGQIASGLASIVGDMAGEQSSAYKAMFAIEKGFAIAQSALAIQTGVSKAIALGFPQNIPVIAQTVMEGAKITSAIKSITDTGFSSGGYTGPGGKYDIAGTVHKGEVVFSQEDVARWGGPSNVESLRKSSQREFKQTELVQGGTNVVAMQPKVTINNYSSEKVETSTNQDGELMVTIGKMLDQKIDSGVDRGIQRNLRQGYPLANAIKGR